MRLDIELDGYTSVACIPAHNGYPHRVIVRMGPDDAHFTGSTEDMRTFRDNIVRAVGACMNPDSVTRRVYEPSLMERGPA